MGWTNEEVYVCVFFSFSYGVWLFSSSVRYFIRYRSLDMCTFMLIMNSFFQCYKTIGLCASELWFVVCRHSHGPLLVSVNLTSKSFSFFYVRSFHDI